MCVHKIKTTSGSLLDTLCLEEPDDDCDYYGLNRNIDNSHIDITALHLNIRGLNSKIGKLMYLIDNSFKYQSPEIVMLCKTWLKSNSPSHNQLLVLLKQTKQQCSMQLNK